MLRVAAQLEGRPSFTPPVFEVGVILARQRRVQASDFACDSVLAPLVGDEHSNALIEVRRNRFRDFRAIGSNCGEGPYTEKKQKESHRSSFLSSYVQTNQCQSSPAECGPIRTLSDKSQTIAATRSGTAVSASCRDNVSPGWQGIVKTRRLLSKESRTGSFLSQIESARTSVSEKRTASRASKNRNRI